MGRRITLAGDGVRWVNRATVLAADMGLLGPPLVRAALFLAAAAWRTLPEDHRADFAQMAREAQRMVEQFDTERTP